MHEAIITVPPDVLAFSADAQRVLSTPNAGGSSEMSEAVSFEILSSLFGCRLERTEMEIEYTPGSKITDYSVRLYGHVIGVSVTRAMTFHKHLFTEQSAQQLLMKKLHGINKSTENVLDEHRWERQILHCFCQNWEIAAVMAQTLSTMDPALIADTIVILTVCRDSTAPWIFYNERTIRKLGMWKSCYSRFFQRLYNLKGLDYIAYRDKMQRVEPAMPSCRAPTGCGMDAILPSAPIRLCKGLS